MNVQNHEKKAFKDMTPEERSAISDAWVDGDDMEVYVEGKWVHASTTQLMSKYAIYRTRPRQLVIPWDVIKPQYKWAAMDESGSLWLYKEKPDLRSTGWYSGSSVVGVDALKIDTTLIDWHESLVQRPE